MALMLLKSVVMLGGRVALDVTCWNNLHVSIQKCHVYNHVVIKKNNFSIHGPLFFHKKIPQTTIVPLGYRVKHALHLIAEL